MNGNKILITGSNGMLGSNLVSDFKIGTTKGFNSLELDITDCKKVYKILSNERPDIIIHTAAYTDVEDSEINQDKAYRINTLGTQNLVNYSIDKEVFFVYISSTGIYGSAKLNEAYTEFDKVEPTTIHHKSKYEAEKIVQNHLSKYLIIRTGWLFGGNIEHNKNFVYKRYLEAKNKGIIYSDGSQIGNPTSIKELIHQIEVLVESKQYGIFNCVNSAVNVSRYDYVRKIINLFALDCKVGIAPIGMFKRIAPVSKNESALNYKLELSGLNIMNSWEKSLEDYIKELKEII